MSWLDGLSTALTAGTKGASGWLEGQQRGRKEAEERAKEIAAALRQKAIDEQNALLNTARIGQIGAETEALKNPLETWGDFEDILNPESGELERVQRSNRGGKRVVGRTPPPKPTNPLVGSEEWKAAERFRASLQPTPITYIQGMGAAGPEFFAAPTRQGGSPKPTGVSTVPTAGSRGQATTSRIIADNMKQTGVIDDALAELKRRPQGVGLLRYAGDAINQRVDPDGIALRALVANIGSLQIKDRSGAAVTVSEFPRLTPFVPRVTDTEGAIRTKLEQLKVQLALHNKSLREVSGDSRQESPEPSGSSRTISRSDYNALVLANGKAKADELLRASNARVAP